MHEGQTISDNGIVWKVVNLSGIDPNLAVLGFNFYDFVAGIPYFYKRTELFSSNKTILTTPSKLMVQINLSGYIAEGSKNIDLTNSSNWCSDSTTYTTAANRAGKDFYIYVCEDNDSCKYLLSVNSTVPGGYTVDNSRKIGGFHCLCNSVGTISGHTLSGYVTGDILPLSIWDLEHRPISEPEGMVWVKEVGHWIDIYLNSWNGSKLVSAYGGTIADGSVNNGHAWHGEKFIEYLGLVSKKLPYRDDFMVFAKGSNEGTNIYGSADPVTTGGHKDTNNRRMISNYGIEDCCGALLQWMRDTYENYVGMYVNNTVRNSANSGSATVTTYPGAYWAESSGYYYLSGYAWKDQPVYNPNVDASKYGSAVGLLRRAIVGGSWTYAATAGSRCVVCDGFSTYVSGGIGARGASEPKK